MKKIIAILLVILTTSFVYIVPPVTKISKEELKYLARLLNDPDYVIGIFRVPEGNEVLRTVKATGDYPESDTGYISLAINESILKLNTLELIKGEADEVVFVKMPYGGISEEGSISFYSFPGTNWLMVLKKGITMDGDKAVPMGWLKDIKNLGKYKWLNSQTAFIADPFLGNYNIKWNGKYEMIPGVYITDLEFTEDLKSIYTVIKNIPVDVTKEDYNASIALLKAKLKTDDGRVLCDLMAKK